MEFSLVPLQRLYIWGQSTLEVLEGDVQVFGFLVKRSRTYDLVSPASTSLLYFENVSNTNLARIKLSNLFNGLEKLHLSSVSLFPKSLDYSSSYTVDQSSLASFSLLEITKDWWNLVTEMSSISRNGLRFVVCGPRKVGKSTFARFTCNYLLNSHQRVAFLDLDNGQSEMTAPGTVSLSVLEHPLLGPPFSNLGLAQHQIHLGFLSPTSSPAMYIASVKQLLSIYFEFYREKSIPLVINMLGWTTGLGLHLLLQLLELSQPTHVAAFRSESLQDNIGSLPDYIQSWHQRCTTKPVVVPITPVKLSERDNDRTRIKAVDLRYLTYLSYFSMEVGTDRKFFHLDRPLWKRPPVCISWSKAIFYVPACFEGISMPKLSLTFEFSLVGIALADGDLTSQSRTSSNGLSWINGTHSNLPECIGMGLIRSVNYQSKIFEVLTPVSLARLHESQYWVLVMSKDLPSNRLIQDHNVSWSPSINYQSPSSSFTGIARNGRHIRSNILLSRISIVKPERARALEGMLINAARMGQLRGSSPNGQVTEADLVALLEKLQYQSTETGKIKFQRRSHMDDDEDY